MAEEKKTKKAPEEKKEPSMAEKLMAYESGNTKGMLEDSMDKVAEDDAQLLMGLNVAETAGQNINDMLKAAAPDMLGSQKMKFDDAFNSAFDQAMNKYATLFESGAAKRAGAFGVIGDILAGAGAAFGLPGLMVGGSRMANSANSTMNRLTAIPAKFINTTLQETLSGQHGLQRQERAGEQAMRQQRAASESAMARTKESGRQSQLLQTIQDTAAMEREEFKADKDIDLFGKQQTALDKRQTAGFEVDRELQAARLSEASLQAKLGRETQVDLAEQKMELDRELKEIDREISRDAASREEARYVTGVQHDLVAKVQREVADTRAPLSPVRTQDYVGMLASAGNVPEATLQKFGDLISKTPVPEETAAERNARQTLDNLEQAAVDEAISMVMKPEDVPGNVHLLNALTKYKDDPEGGLHDVTQFIKSALAENPDRFAVTPAVDAAIEKFVTGAVSPGEAFFVEDAPPESRTPQRSTILAMMGHDHETVNLTDLTNIPKNVIDATPVMRGVKTTDTVGEVAQRIYKNMEAGLKDVEIDGIHYVEAAIGSKVQTSTSIASGNQFVTLKAHRDLTIPRIGTPIVLKKGEEWAGQRKTWAELGHPDAYKSAKKTKTRAQTMTRVFNEGRRTPFGKNEMRNMLRRAVEEFGNKGYDVGGGGKLGGVHGYAGFTDELINQFLTWPEYVKSLGAGDQGLPAEWHRMGMDYYRDTYDKKGTK